MVFKLGYICIENMLTSWGQRSWFFWESLTLAVVKAVHPSMADDDTERTMLCHI